MSYDFAEQDLVHIRNVLGYLERSADYVRQTEADAVVSLDYWRARVRAIVVMPSLPMHIETQAKELLGRIDRLERMHATTGSTSTAQVMRLINQPVQTEHADPRGGVAQGPDKRHRRPRT